MKINITDKNNLLALRMFASNELENILNFWTKNAIDNMNGGFVGKIDGNGTIDFNASKGLILNARILWSFSVAYKTLKRPEHLESAHRAYNYIATYFADKKYGGYFWMLNNKGEPEDSKKQIYAQAFVIYAFSEYYAITQNQDCLEAALAAFKHIENYAFDRQKNGYFEAFTREWDEIGDLRLSTKDMNEKKTMNTHLHVLEAYASLYNVSKEPELERPIKNLLDIFTYTILNKDDYHYDLFFDENWTRKSDIISFGHDIEGSWLLYEAAEILGDEQYIERLKKIAIKMAGEVLQAINKDGGLEHDRHRGEEGDGDLEWWAQAEALVGFINAYQLSGNSEFVNVAARLKDFIDKYFIDKKRGEWYYRLDKNYIPYNEYDKVGIWKCPYHNSRMCFELLKRLKDI